MKTTSTATALGNTLNTLRWVFRRAFRFGVCDSDASSLGKVLPGVLMYWRRLAGRMTHPLIAIRLGHQTTTAISHPSIVNVSNAPAEPSWINLVFVDQRGPFHYRSTVQNVLYATAREAQCSLPRPSISPERLESGIAPSSASHETASVTTTIRWRRFAATVHVGGTTWVSRQEHVAAASITTILDSIRAGRRMERPTRPPIAGVQETVARLAESPAISRPNIRRIVTQAAQSDEDIRSGPAGPFQFRTRNVARGSSAPHADFDGPRVTAPLRLAWRRSEAAQDSTPPRTVPQADQHGVARDYPAAAPSVAPQSTQVMTEKPPARTPEAIIKDFLSGPTLDRLAEDVLRRVDKRMRIERERRGL